MLAAVAVASGLPAGPGWAGEAEEGLVVVLEPKIEGALNKDEQAQLEAAVADALRAAQLQVVPPSDRDAVLSGEPELRGCRTDECLDRVGRLLSAQSVLAQTWQVERAAAPATPATPPIPAPAAAPAAPAPAPAEAPAAHKGRHHHGKALVAPPPPPLRPAGPAPAPVSPPGRWHLGVALFNVGVGAVGDKETQECAKCDVTQAGAMLAEMVRKAVYLDAARARGTVEVSATPSADVLVDGRKLGFTPYKRQAFVGKHDITVSRTGYHSIHQTVNVEEGKRVSLNLTLQQGEDRRFQEVRRPRPLWRYLAGAGAIAGGAVLIGVGASALSVNGQCADGPSGNPPCPTVMEGGKAVQHQINTTGIGAGLVTVGAVLAVAGGVVIALPGEKHLVEVSAGALGTGGGLRLAGSF